MSRPPLSSVFCFIVLAVLQFLVARSGATDITVYKDSECLVSQDNINGPNGYPDGTCTLLRDRVTSNFSSFQVVDLDEGCGVTIYGSNSNSLSCSSEAIQVAELATCYNTSWVYYSIDQCISPKDIASTTSSSSTSTASSSSSASGNSSSSSTGAIAGGVVGGVAGLALIAGALFYFLRKRRQAGASGSHDSEQSHPHEMGSDHARSELQAGGMHKYELAAKGPSEMEELRAPPAEMEGDHRFAPQPGIEGMR
ncbi:uncharacterized protein LTHEOB_10977 [Lasiodiplodia theobromae]|uniref:uncharacterized protein n=1 Tax=Lasiodiplodia theobromae TaxID=45133 RepID=UPI0015C338B1|nr:uncharacterized protein LTHEOB_10977 [Lasiodiplodia theobromae]KAF4538207.1 hypothetical protein LTHEOB_10977 [Lasiodiplodia theobromae]